MRKLGRTNLKVGVIGFGAMWLPGLKVDDAVDLVERGLELKINYFDTARNYGDSEEKLGLALEGKRDRCVIATKTGSKTMRESLKDLKQSLQRLKTDRIDILQLHGIDNSVTLRKAIGANGALQTCKRARKKGLVDFIGISSHRPNVLVEAIETEEFDTVLVPLNILTPQATEELLPASKDYDVGVVVMKPFAFKVANMMTWQHHPSFSFFSNEPELESFFGRDDYSRVRNALGFVLSQEIATVIPGFKHTREVERAVKAEKELGKLTPKKRQVVQAKLEDDYCRDCGLCLPCPQKLNIPAIMRFYDLHHVYKLETWAQKLYNSLEVKAESCNGCGDCVPKCPHGILIDTRLRKISEISTRHQE